jgi:hypothetical protein
MNSALRTYKPQARLQGLSLARSLKQNISNQETRGLPSHQAASPKGSELDYHREQEADRRRMPNQGAAPATSWDFARIPVYHPSGGCSPTLARATDLDSGDTRTDGSRRSATPRPHIELGAISLNPLPVTKAHDVAPRDGSPDDLEEMQDDQDALTPAVFERGTTGRGVHIRVSGGNPTGTPDFPDGIRWVQTIDTNAPLFGQSPPYVDFILPKDDKPFYFPDAKENATFSDNPTRKTNGVHWDATLSLVGVSGREITRFDSVNYGFAINASGTLSLHAPSTTGVMGLVIHGDTLRSEYPNWVFSGGFTVPQVPSSGAAGGTATA